MRPWRCALARHLVVLSSTFLLMIEGPPDFVLGGALSVRLCAAAGLLLILADAGADFGLLRTRTSS